MQPLSYENFLTGSYFKEQEFKSKDCVRIYENPC